MSAALGDATRRDELAALLMNEALAIEADGLVLDFEDLRGAASNYSAFIALLVERMHARGKQLMVTTPPPCPVDVARAKTSRDSTCAREDSSYDFAALVSAADAIAVMVYDHDTSGERAPQGRAWTEGVLDGLSARVPRESWSKVLVGVPYYGRMSARLTGRSDVWPRAVAGGRVHGKVATVSNLTYDSASLARVGTITIEERPSAQGETLRRTGPIFLENHESLRDRLTLTRGHGFGGVAIWRLGDEDPCNVAILMAYRENSRLTPIREPCVVP